MAAPETPRRYVVRTLGCKANLYDSLELEAELRRRGWAQAEANDAESVELCIVNSCTVTDEADLQSRKLASRLSRESPRAAVVMTGCAAEVDPERLARSKGIHYVVGNQDKKRLVDLVLERVAAGTSRPSSEDGGEILGSVRGYAEMRSRHPEDREWSGLEQPERGGATAADSEAGSFGGRTRAFLKIQEGCNSFCTYCVIPYGRGPSRSLKPNEVLDAVRKLVRSGTREVVITGTNIGDYGSDWAGPSSPGAPRARLTELFQLILEETELARLRVAPLDPTEIEAGLLELAGRNPRFCPHFHVSLQSVNEKILRLMKRRYGREEIESTLRQVAALRAPLGGAFIGMDVIAGFPGETLEDFEEGMSWLASLPWNRLHVFPYSERDGTPATRLPGSVPKAERHRRARALSQLSFERMQTFYERLLQQGQSEEFSDALLEMHGGREIDGCHYRSGYTSNYLRVLVECPRTEPGNRLVGFAPFALHLDKAAGEAALVAKSR